MSLKDKAALLGACCLTSIALLLLVIAVVSLSAAKTEGEKRIEPVVSNPLVTAQVHPSASQSAGGQSPIAASPTPEHAAMPSLAGALAFCRARGVETHDAPLLDGTPRVLGTAPTHDLNCEIVGNPTVESVGLMLPIAASDRRTSAVRAFMALAAWKDGEKWFDLAGENEMKAVDAVTFTVHRRAPLNMITLDMERTGHAH
ncbi:MAG TPA: hypothetical protein VMI54_15775 [Polyangiaceae bacterium]|nr:hypothetical protein [Polyangiaceae bacterium]